VTVATVSSLLDQATLAFVALAGKTVAFKYKLLLSTTFRESGAVRLTEATGIEESLELTVAEEDEVPEEAEEAAAEEEAPEV
jgi:hypothetical protein